MRWIALFIAVLPAMPAAALDFHDPRALVEAALARQPALARIRAEAAAARERVAPAGALPNPMVMGGLQNKMIDLSDDDMTMVMLGVSQKVVRGERREALRAAAALEATGIEAELASVSAEVERDVLLAWYDLAAADAQLAAIAAVWEMSEAMVATARVRYEVGGAAQADVIRAQLGLSDLEREAVRLRGERRAALASLLPLLGLPAGTEVPPLAMPDREPAISVEVVVPDDHAAFAALRSEAARADEQLRLARLETRPDVELEFQYGFRRETPLVAHGAESRRDMFSVLARVELPLRREQTIEPRAREAIAMRDAARAGIEEVRQALALEVARAAAAHTAAAEQLRLLDEVLVPQARLAFDSALAAYQSGQAGFDGVLATQTSFLRLGLERAAMLARRDQALVTLDALRKGARSGVATKEMP